MNWVSVSRRFCMAAVALTALAGVAGCEKEAPKSAFPTQTVKKYERATTLGGLISDDKGPIKAGSVKVSDEKGNVVAETSLQDSDRYQIEVPAGTPLPVIVTYYPLQAGEPLYTVVVYPNVTKFDITPMSTAIAKKAKEMGGYTHGNMMVAAQTMGTVPDDNKMTAGFRGDPTKQYGGWH